MRYKNYKNIKFVITTFVFLSSKCTTIHFRPGLDPLDGWGWGYPLSIPLLARRLRRLELGLGFQAPSTQNPGYASGI